MYTTCATLVLIISAVYTLPLNNNNDTDIVIIEDELLNNNTILTDLDNNNNTTSMNETENAAAGLSDDIIKSVRDHAEGPIVAGSDKLRRLEAIRNAILNSTGRTERPTNGTDGAQSSGGGNPYREFLDHLKKFLPWTSTDGYTEKVQSFYPVCPPPSGPLDPPPPSTDDKESMNLFLLFNLSYPTPLEGTVLSIVAATLKLYKFSQDNQSSSSSVPPCPPRPHQETTEALEQAVAAAAAANSLLPPLPLPAPVVVPAQTYVEDDRRIRVSVYYYMRGHKKNRLRRKMLDTKMVPVTGDEWVDLNVRAAARYWRNASKNLGLVVEVEDEEGKPLMASNFFSDMNCSKEAAAVNRPIIPSFLIDAARGAEGHENTTLQYNADLFPVIDLCTMDLPKSNHKLNKQPIDTPAGHLIYPDLTQHHSNKHPGESHHDEATSMVLVPFHKLSEIAGNIHPSLPTTPSEINETESRQHEHETIIPEQNSSSGVLEEAHDMIETQNEEPHPHRHHRQETQHHNHDTEEEVKAHSHEDFSSQHEDDSSIRQQTHRLHHRFHHHGHRFHSAGDSDDWSGETSQRLVVIPASELLALSQQIERDDRLQQELSHQHKHHKHHQQR